MAKNYVNFKIVTLSDRISGTGGGSSGRTLTSLCAVSMME